MALKEYSIAFVVAGKLSSDFAKTFNTANNTIKGCCKQINDLNKQAADIGKLVKLKRETGEAACSFFQANRKIAELGRAINTNGAPMRTMIADFNNAETAVSGAKIALDRKRASLRTMQKETGQTGITLQTLIRREKELAAASETASKTAANRTTSNPSPSLATAGVTVSFFSDIIRTGAEFSGQMSRVGAISRASSEDLAKMTVQAKELGKSTVWSSSQAGDGMQYLAMAGFRANEIMQAMPGMLDLASAGQIDLGRAADIVSRILTGFNLKTSETGRAGDVLVNTFTSSNTSLETLGATMKYAVPVAKSVGASLETTAAMAGKLGDAGVQGEMAGAALRAVMLGLFAPSKAGAKAMEKLGISAKDAEGKWRSCPAVLADLQKAMSGMSKSARAEYTKAIFGAEAMSGAMVLMEQAGSGALQEYAESLKESGSAQRIAKKQNDNLAGDYQAMTNALEGMKLSIYSGIEPALRSLTQVTTMVISEVTAWTEEHPALTSAIALTAASAGGLVTAVSAATIALKTVKGMVVMSKLPFIELNALITGNTRYARVNTAVLKIHETGITVWRKACELASFSIKGFSGAMKGMKAVMVAHPFMAVVLGMMALVTAGMLVYENWGRIKEQALVMWQITQNVFHGIASAFIDLYNTAIVPIATGICHVFEGVWIFLKNIFLGNWTAAWEGAKQVFSGVWQSLVGIAKFPLNAIIGMINAVIGGINGLGSIEIAGKTISMVEIPKIPMLSAGGIATAPTLSMIGEGKEPEAVLPLSRLDNLLGTGGSGGGIHVSFSPVININGGSPDSYSQVSRGLQEGQQNLKRELERLMNNQRRLSYV